MNEGRTTTGVQFRKEIVSCSLISFEKGVPGNVFRPQKTFITSANSKGRLKLDLGISLGGQIAICY